MDAYSAYLATMLSFKVDEGLAHRCRLHILRGEAQPLAAALLSVPSIRQIVGSMDRPTRVRWAELLLDTFARAEQNMT